MLESLLRRSASPLDGQQTPHLPGSGVLRDGILPAAAAWLSLRPLSSQAAAAREWLARVGG
ncbi:hypothetical protein [Thermogemmatispora sp.]|uniref:hypothetical protein n=1 Tax=Thermogemmatispora sp. TaxID=1968838 RepID=UPI001D2D4710|nr:hypothetical protein [Thermogemmatispora sp.]MBX5449178.1 hypothetical protein [Thermogemmatispora sp.]